MKKIIDKIKKFGIIETIILCIYIIILLIIAINHECYEDETQSWLIARDLNLIKIIEQMKYEGHSFLWYYILAPFAKLGFPVETQIYISCIFAIATVYIILKKAPFNILLKILLAFSSGMIYFYSIISRPYCMIPFLLACIAIIYKDRKKHQYIYATLIALLANTHLIMLPTAIMLAITFWGKELIIKIKRKTQTKKEKILLFKSLSIAMFGIFVYILIALFTLTNCQIIDNFDKTDTIYGIGRVFQLIKDTSLKTIKYFYGSSQVPLYYQLTVLFVLILCIIGSKDDLTQALIFWSQLIFTILLHSFSWFILATRVFITIYTLMFWLWVYKEQECKKNIEGKKLIEIALIVLILISNPSIYKLAYQDITGNFSTGKMTANYIKENIPEDSCFICSMNELQQSVVAYLEKDKYKFYMPNSENFVTYITWDEGWNTVIMPKDIEESILKLKNDYENLYILSTMPLDSTSYEYVFSTENELIENSIYVRTEIFYIYKII